MNIREIYTGLNKNGYICDPPFAAKVTTALATRPQAGAFLFGASGTGKTYLPEVIADITSAQLIFQQCFPGTREEDLMVRLIPNEATKSGIMCVNGVISETIALLQESDQHVVLALDEWDKTRPSADAFLLDFLQNGRIRYAGRPTALTTEQRRRLTVFVTMNDERDISEVLLRRLPKIDFNLLPSDVVRQALMLSHPDHPLIGSCVTLYRRCAVAQLPKPCTIQELRQLIDAADLLDIYADWDMLVYQFVTKTPEAHTLLIAAERAILPQTEVECRPRLQVAAYGIVPASTTKFPSQPKLPSLSQAKKFERASGESTEIETSQAGGIVRATDTTYDALLDWAGPPTIDPADIGGIGHVNGDAIIIGTSLPLTRHADMSKLWGETGEISFIVRTATFDEVMGLRNIGWKVVSYSQEQLIAKTTGMMLSWTKTNGVEIIVSLADKGAFDAFIDTSCPATWLAIQTNTSRITKTKSKRIAA